ncbi:MAG TPA: hypothetical protein VLE99_00185 [Candidatus Saccharimonadales bacterium]|nr:hypothetical protein [Candidatus Saccharimonadales bacterium]
MKIGVVGSMQFTEQMMQLCEKLRRLGHDAYMSKFAASFVGKTDSEAEKIKLEQKYQQDAIREDCKWVADMDALLIANYDKHGISGYIGGNAFIEMAYAHILGKPLYALQPLHENALLRYRDYCHETGGN